MIKFTLSAQTIREHERKEENAYVTIRHTSVQLDVCCYCVITREPVKKTARDSIATPPSSGLVGDENMTHDVG